MIAIADAVAAAGLSSSTKIDNPVVEAFVRESHLRQDPEGFAQSCEALASAKGADLRLLRCPTLAGDRRGGSDRPSERGAGACGEDQGR